MDLEGYTKNMLYKKVAKEEIIEKLVELIREFKGYDQNLAERWADAIIQESKTTLDVKNYFARYERSGVKIGDIGVGSRGLGDFYVHSKIGEIIGKTSAIIDSKDMDDSGVVKIDKSKDPSCYIVVSVDGIHSRLSDFPFLSGFHVTKATLRDIYVMGARPVALLSDIHVADDGDVSKIFEHIAGISSVSKVMDVPLITGSTLRIGGDMVIGDRMTGCVGAVGVANYLTARSYSSPGDVILMSEGSGGGTISTTALYYGEEDVVSETLNVRFLTAADSLIKSDLIKKIHTMTDVTNGGLRGDLNEISKTAKIKLIFYEDKVRSLVNKKVLDMLNRHEIDYLGVSLDSLLVICPPEMVNDIKDVLKSKNVRIEEIGHVEEGTGVEMVEDGINKKFEPKFRESAYTPIKKVVGEVKPANFEDMTEKIDKSVQKAIGKRDRMIDMLNAQLGNTKE
ncbi:MAG TPA: hypothetical protein HA341_00055 [Halobacteria archaeon]|jgi:hydrogenase expression/formation protein|nr:hypothetical protein [Halobacteria archaeon]